MREKTMKSGIHGPIRVTIVHQNRIFRECLAAVLSEGGRFLVKQVDHTLPGCAANISAEHPQVALIDLGLPEQLALELTHQIRQQQAAPRIILLTHARTPDDLVECFAAGAAGCVLEETSLQDLREAIERVAEGGTFCSHALVHSMLHRMAQRVSESDRPKDGGIACLTPRELEIVRLIAEHLSNKQIARRLSVSLFTVKNHVHNIVEKLQVSGRYEAVDFARKHRWLDVAKGAAPGRCEH
jgi:DNA-binding NarL/FixJ family response regulator